MEIIRWPKEISEKDAFMKRPQIVPSAPPPEAYYLPVQPPPQRPPPRLPGPSSPVPVPCWQAPPSSLPPRYGSNTESFELNYEEINDKTPRNPEKPSRFNVKPGKHKKRFNPQLHTQRGCTDVACCFLFLLFTIGWGVVAAIGFLWGDAERLILPTDTAGRRCGGSRGISYNLTNRPYLYYFDMTKCISYTTALGGCQTPQMCVAACPTKYFSYLQLQSPTISGEDFRQTVMSSVYCLDEVNRSTITSFAILRSYVQQQKCASYTVKSAPGE
ncbi:unnamed protein product [Cylicocyclus nassatus]|uniref:Uncharacterized protein n=1 Tax=Cylicocyclus nassatus TaxID=53992 RepID=A0AA36HGK5_CYLNA|nr:unnamed protein product [Cylicocyclus nassatus]